MANKNRYKNTKFIRYTVFILLMTIIGIFLHSELRGHFSAEQQLEQHDYCHLVVTTIVTQQFVFHKLEFAFLGAFFSLKDYATDDEKIDSKNFTVPFPAISQVPRTILFQSFLI